MPSKLRTLSVNQFRQLYFEEKQEIKEIAAHFGVSRTTIYKWFRRYKSGFPLGLQRRSGNKFGYTFDELFFDEWSPKMAYVLGLLATDGNISKFHMTFKVTDLELVEKLKNLMRSNCPIKIVSPRGWSRKEQYSLTISSTRLVKKLRDLGVGPLKSLTIEFPSMPKECIRHYLRGCWDGDGSFYFESARKDQQFNRAGKDNIPIFRASIVSGSKQFIEGIITAIDKAGIKPQRRPHAVQQRDKSGRSVVRIPMYTTRRGKNPSYEIKLGSANAIAFGRLIYEDVPESMYLTRKFEIFHKAKTELKQLGK